MPASDQHHPDDRATSRIVPREAAIDAYRQLDAIQTVIGHVVQELDSHLAGGLRHDLTAPLVHLLWPNGTFEDEWQAAVDDSTVLVAGLARMIAEWFVVLAEQYDRRVEDEAAR